MRIGILADTHNQVERTSRAVETLLERGAQRLFHCGDLMSPEVVATCLRVPAYFVRGNNDLDFPALDRAMRAQGAHDLGEGGEVALDGRRIAMTHGHLPKVVRALLSAEPDYLFLGHSHRQTDRKEGRTRIVNPGALHRVVTFSVALLDLQRNTLEFIEIAR
jgi:putative phosphoesterase